MKSKIVKIKYEQYTAKIKYWVKKGILYLKLIHSTFTKHKYEIFAGSRIIFLSSSENSIQKIYNINSKKIIKHYIYIL